MNWVLVALILGALVLLCFLLAIANFSGERFVERYREMDEIELREDITPREFVYQINNDYFDGQLQVVPIQEEMGDAYYKKQLFLSLQTLSSPSIASFTIIAHEIGHALQDKKGNKLKTLAFLRRLGKFLGLLLAPALIAGLVLLCFEEKYFLPSVCLLGGGALIFFIALFIKMKTISIEKDASKNAIIFLKEYVSEQELSLCQKFLNDARLTYWADFLRTFLAWTFLTKRTKLFN